MRAVAAICLSSGFSGFGTRSRPHTCAVSSSIGKITSVYAFLRLLETFNYPGMHFGGVAHVNCRDEYLPAMHDAEAVAFTALVRGAVPVHSPLLGSSAPGIRVK
jgi:hypothetical protein